MTGRSKRNKVLEGLEKLCTSPPAYIFIGNLHHLSFSCEMGSIISKFLWMNTKSMPINIISCFITIVMKCVKLTWHGQGKKNIVCFHKYWWNRNKHDSIRFLQRASLFTCVWCEAQLSRRFHNPSQRWRLHPLPVNNSSFKTASFRADGQSDSEPVAHVLTYLPT